MGHAMVSFPDRNVLYLFGGQKGSLKMLDDIWSFNADLYKPTPDWMYEADLGTGLSFATLMPLPRHRYHPLWPLHVIAAALCYKILLFFALYTACHNHSELPLHLSLNRGLYSPLCLSSGSIGIFGGRVSYNELSDRFYVYDTNSRSISSCSQPGTLRAGHLARGSLGTFVVFGGFSGALNEVIGTLEMFHLNDSDPKALQLMELTPGRSAPILSAAKRAHSAGVLLGDM
jgi:hypothetical protein